MREVERYGVKMDICQTSGGIWLDKGELEKIIMMIREEALHDAPTQHAPTASHHDYDDDAERYQQQSPNDQRHPRRKKKDSIFDNLMDIFDM